MTESRNEIGEMNYAAQLIGQLDAADVASFKEMAFWSGLHENTVRNYCDGSIKHFGSESRFWNGVLTGLCKKFAPAVPPVAYRIVTMLTKGTPICIASVVPWGETEAPLPTVFRQFAAISRALGDAADSAADIYRDGAITANDDPTIAQLETQCDQIIARAWQVKARVARERAQQEAKR